MLSNKVYEWIKWLGLIALPSLSVFIQTTGEAIGIADVNKWVIILNGLGVLIGALVGYSTYSYRKEDKDDGEEQ